MAWLEAQSNCQRVEIIQTYLQSEDGEDRRVRQRGENGTFLYYETIKRTLPNGQVVELSRRITDREYLSLLLDADTSRRQLRKTRFCMTYGKQSLKIDLYPFWKNQAMVQLHMRDKDEPVDFPPELKLIREVTGVKEYKNSSLALKIPEE